MNAQRHPQRSSRISDPACLRQPRRQWLASILRGTALVLLAGLSALLLVRSRRASAQSCNRLPCQACGRWSGCSLPLAIATRQSQNRSR
jgi:hypothetical protein